MEMALELQYRICKLIIAMSDTRSPLYTRGWYRDS